MSGRPTCPVDHAHDLTCAHSHRCACGGCRDLERAYFRRWYARRLAGKPTSSRVDASATRLRLRALARSGWTMRRIAAESGAPEASLQRALSGQSARIEAVTARRVARFFRDHLGTEPTYANRYELGGGNRARRDAEARGWPTVWEAARRLERAP